MTQEQKDLLSKDLCSRLPYEVKIKTEYFTKATLIEIRKNISYGACKDLLVTYDISGEETPYQTEERSSTISKIKPYLFPLSSMTEEQAKEMQEIVGSPKVACIMRKTGGLELWLDSVDTDPTIWLDTIFEVQDWLNKNHFDYHNLIDKNLAIDCTNLNIY